MLLKIVKLVYDKYDHAINDFNADFIYVEESKIVDNIRFIILIFTPENKIYNTIERYLKKSEEVNYFTVETIEFGEGRIP